jgi:hypothetical protein
VTAQDVYRGRGVVGAAAAQEPAESGRRTTKCLVDVALTRHFV